MYRRIKNSNIPYTSITKEVWLSLVKTLEEDQIGQIITAMYDYIYTGKEPSFNSKVMNGQWDMLIENLERMSKGYFSKADNGVASAKKRIENKKKNQTQPETNNSIEPQDDIVVPQKAEISPNKPDFYSDDTEVPKEVKSVSDGLKQGEFDNTIEEFENNIYNEDNMGTFIGYIPNFSVETRAEKTEFNVPKFIEYLKEHNNCLYNKMIRTPSKGLNLDMNMKRLKECIDGQLKVFLPDNTKRQQVYIYIIENNNN